MDRTPEGRRELDASVALALSGTFTTHIRGALCRLELSTATDRSVRGRLEVGGRAYPIRGGVTRQPNALYGYLLDPHSGRPLARLHVRLRGEGLRLELDLPPEAGAGVAPHRSLFSPAVTEPRAASLAHGARTIVPKGAPADPLSDPGRRSAVRRRSRALRHVKEFQS